MKKIILTVGLPASGKSTWAKDFIVKRSVDYGEQWKRVNKDDLRAMLDNGRWSKHNEKFVLSLRDHIVRDALKNGMNVIVDDTNLHEKHYKKMEEIAKEVGNVKVEVKDFTHVDLKTCIQRDLGRANSVGEKVIVGMYKQFLKEEVEIEPFPYDDKLPDAIICDLDGTLAIIGDRSPYDAANVHVDTVNPAVAAILGRFMDYEDPDEVRIIFMSGRDGAHKKETKKWLNKHGFSYRYLYMRAPGDKRKDSIVKQELLDKHVRGKFNVLFVLDDRNQVVEMWRANGLTCLQVAEGDF